MGNGNRGVRLSISEARKLHVLEEVNQGRRTQVQAGKALHVSDRQVRKLLKRLKAQGAAGLVHGNRGRASKRRIADVERAKLVKLYQERYTDFNLTHFREQLQEREKLKPPSRETLRAVLREAGVWQRRRDAPKHRLRRPRRAQEGELLQVDASFHAWFGEDQPVVALVGAVDDATGDVPHAQFFPAETTQAYLTLVKQIVRKRGVPQALYRDRDSVFQVNNGKTIELLKAQGKTPQTQFSRAMSELGIELIPAYSPQAKGRIERLWKTFQDRLLKELKLEGIRTLEAANRYVAGPFLQAYNRKFKRVAQVSGSAYGSAPSAQRLEGILCSKHTRVLAKDHTFSLEGVFWQVLPNEHVVALTGRSVEVRQTLRGTVEAWYGSNRLRIMEAPADLPRAASQVAVPAYRVRGRVRL